jgi:SP family facilitated glucose transporter-like MFS transporter 3
MNAPGVVFPGHSTGEWSIAVASFAIGGPLGAIMGGKWQTSAVDVGRSSCSLHPVFLCLVCCRPCLEYVYYYRVPFIGFASGFSSVLVPIYLGELAPPTLRGFWEPLRGLQWSLAY